MMRKLEGAVLKVAEQAHTHPSDNESSRNAANGPSSFPRTCTRQDIT